MYSVYTPITYNTNLNSVLAHYRFGFCGGYCHPHASLFNKYSTFGNVASNFSWMYPTLCPDSKNIKPATNSGIVQFPSMPYVNKKSGVFFDTSLPMFFVQPKQSFSPVYASFPARNPFAASGNLQNSVQTPLIYPNIDTKNNKIKNTSVPVVVASSKKNYTPAKPSANIADLRDDFVTTARNYSKCSEQDGSHHKFCVNDTCKYEDPFDQEWCTDFVTYVVKETYKNNGKKLPEGFGNHDVATLKNWAIKNGYFTRTSNKSQKAGFIAQNIKPGDIMILNENGASHTGFVTKVDKNTGIIHTIEGNRDDKVTEYAYSPNFPDLSGFIRLTA